MEATITSPKFRNFKLAWGLVALFAGCGGDSDPEPVITIAVSGAHSAEVGNTVSLAAITLNGSDTTYTWASADATIATVDDSGVVTGIAAGETEVTATGGQTAAKGNHTFVVLPETVIGGAPVITISGVYAIPLGGTATMMATTSNGTDSGYTWTSDTPDVVSIDENGVATGNSVGVTVLTAEGTGRTATFGLTVTINVPVFEQWAGSGHAKRAAEAFRHWDGDDPAEVPASCARCHSSAGFSDYVGADGTAAGAVDGNHAVPNGISCVACHTP